ncbi:MAG: hypothetical protein IJT68_08400 [Lentisphaeria bacterium]|nr:hypothetical protein [Lentisphaeria bacterium]MBR3506002.1 hypothetical protein [Lentisphaeria bacterium]
MNFRTVGIIRNGLRRGESGQAFAELTVSLVAILAAFAGFLLVAALSTDRVSMLIRAREEADRKSSSGVSSQGGESIRYWDYGADEIPFTTDDRAVPGSAGDGAMFKRELADNTGHVTLTNPPSSALGSDFASLQDSNMFVNAASLASGDARTTNSLNDHNIGGLESALRLMFGLSDIHVEDTVYMPAHKDLSDERCD